MAKSLIRKVEPLPCEGEWRAPSPRAHRGATRRLTAHFGLFRAALCTISCTSVLAACGGGGDDPSPPTTPAAACRPAVRIQLYGDSTQTQAWHDGYLQQILDARYGAGRVSLIDQAASGTRSVDLLAGADGKNPPWPGSVDADIAIVNHGINDAGARTPMETFRDAMLTFATTAGVQMVLETPSPVTYANALGPLDDAPYAAATRDVAAQTGAPLADTQAFVLSLQDWPTMLQPDHIHPSPELQQLIAENVTAPALEPLIDGLICR
jgi:lysophospholipase L1-like esterase